MSNEHDPMAPEAARDPKNAKLAKKQVEANDIKWLMSSRQGRRVVARLIDFAGVYRSTFTGNSETFFKEGMRNVGLFLVAEIGRHAPETYAQMTNESRTTE